MSVKASAFFSAGGILAALLWSSTVCLCGSLSAKLGALSAASFIYVVAGSVYLAGLLPLRGFGAFKGLSSRRLLACGAPFVLYVLAFYLAIGLAKTPRQLIEVGLINYFWPALILLLSVPMQGCKANLLLPVGIVLGVSGIFLASASFNGGLSLAELVADFGSSPAAYALAFLAAFLWALYSNFSRLYERESSEVEIPSFMLLAGLLLLPAGPLAGERPSWDLQTALVLFATALFPGVLACVLWDAAARKGNFVFVSAFAYLIPLFSTIMTGLVFKTPLPPGVWLACLLVAGGAALCQLSLKPGRAAA